MDLADQCQESVLEDPSLAGRVIRIPHAEMAVIGVIAVRRMSWSIGKHPGVTSTVGEEELDTDPPTRAAFRFDAEFVEPTSTGRSLI